MINTVLLAGIGGDIAQGIAIILKETRKNLLLIRTDIHDQHGGSLFVDKYFTVPRANSSEYIASFNEILEKNY